MLEDISPKEFEDWCKVLLERHFHCEVEGTPYVGDEGRDLVVHHPSGEIIVECKHQPHSAVGRPVVQKLDSAIRKANAQKGMIITTGRVAKSARQYADELDGVEIEFVESAKLSCIAQTTGLLRSSSYIDRDTTLALKTIPDRDFPKIFRDSIFSEPRFIVGTGSDLDQFNVTRTTSYEGFFVGDFSASGQLNTAVRVFSASWEGTVLVAVDGGNCSISKTGLPEQRLLPLAQVLESSAGSSSPPIIQAHQAMSLMKEHLVGTCSRAVRYTGGNNVTYVRKVRPKSRSVHITNVRLVYFPRQRFMLRTGKTLHIGDVREEDDRFLVHSATLSRCCVCGRETTEESQVLCAVCHEAAHAWSFLTPDSYRCCCCGATVCRKDTRRFGKKTICVDCSTGNELPLRKRWLPHLVLGLAISILSTAPSLALLLSGRPISDSKGLYAILLIVALIATGIGWRPYLYVRRKLGSGKMPRSLSYAILRSEAVTRMP